MNVQRVSFCPVRSEFAAEKISQNGEKFTTLTYANDRFTPSQKTVSFKGLVGGGMGLGIGGLLALAAAAATGVGAPAAIAMLIAGETIGAKTGSKIGDAVSDGDNDD